MSISLLIVEDDASFAELVAEAVKSREYEVVTAEKLVDAEKIIADREFDLMIVDGLLPDGNGVDFIEKARNAGSTAKIIFVSFFWRDAQSFNRLTTKFGVSAVLRKPLQVPDLLTEIDKAFGAKTEDTADDDFGGGMAGLDKLNEGLAKLAMEYAITIPDQITEMTGHMRNYDPASGDLGPVTAARTIAHKLHGTAGTHGFSEISQAAGEIEKALLKIINEPNPDLNVIWGELNTHGGTLIRTGREAADKAQADIDRKNQEELIAQSAGDDGLFSLSSDEAAPPPPPPPPLPPPPPPPDVDAIPEGIDLPPVDDPPGGDALPDMASDDGDFSFNEQPEPSSASDASEDVPAENDFGFADEPAPIGADDIGPSTGFEPDPDDPFATEDDPAPGPDAETEASPELDDFHMDDDPFADPADISIDEQAATPGAKSEAAVDPEPPPPTSEPDPGPAPEKKSAAAPVPSAGIDEAFGDSPECGPSEGEPAKAARPILDDSIFDEPPKASKKAGSKPAAVINEPISDIVEIPIVLAITDNEKTKKQLQTLTDNKSIEVHFAKSRSKAIDKAAKNWIDCALVEVDKDGSSEPFQIAGELRSRPGLANLPLIFLSGEPTVTQQLAAVRAGATSFLFQPIDEEDLSEVIDRLSAARRGEQPRILVIDDDEASLRAINKIIENARMNVAGTSDPTKAMDLIKKTRPDLLLLDVMMPYINGFEIASMIRNDPIWQQLPIIFISAQQGVDVRVAGYNAGGDDFMEKPLDSEDLITRINVRLRNSRTKSIFDAQDRLTGLLTRRSFLNIIPLRLQQAQHSGDQFHIGVIDLDDFHQLNEKHGYETGDRVLAALGKVIANRLGKGEGACRWTGEQFVLVLENATAEKTIEKLTEISEDFAGIEFVSDERQPIEIGFSGAVASYPPDGSKIEFLVVKAEEKINKARETGNGQIVK